MRMVYTGTDGSTWDILSGPVRLSTRGVEGFGNPSLTWHETQTAGHHGRITKGFVLDGRDLFLPMHFKGDAEGDVEGIQRDWWKACALGGSARVDVWDDDDVLRSLDVRVESDGQQPFTMDPHLWHPPFGLTLRADSAFWQGKPSTVSLVRNDTAVDAFYGGGREGFAYSWNQASAERPRYATAYNASTGELYYNFVPVNARMRDEDWTGWTWTPTPTADPSGNGAAALVAAGVGTIVRVDGLQEALVGSAPVMVYGQMTVENRGPAAITLGLTLHTPTGDSGTTTVTLASGGKRTFYALHTTDANGATLGMSLRRTTAGTATNIIVSDAVVSTGGFPPHAFDGDTGLAPRFYLLEPSGGTTGTLVNEGDVEAWPVWTVRGPSEAFTAGVGGNLIAGPIIVPAGQALVIDTDPLAQTVLLNGVNVWRQLTSADFAPIPPDGSVLAAVTVTGQGSIEATVRPQYRRAF